MYKKEEILARIKEIENSDDDYDTKITLTDDALREYKGEDRVIPFSEYKVGERNNAFQTGIADLDKITDGLGKGDVITLTAESGGGKSTFSRFLLKKLSEQQLKSLYFSYEETNEEFLSKFMGDIPEGYLPMVLNDTSPTWIEARIFEAILKYKVDVVFIDNLTMLVNYGAIQNVSIQITGIMKRLKQVALKYNVIIVLMHHIKKQDSTIIERNSLNDSLSVVNISSLVIALRRKLDESQTKKDILRDGPKKSNYVLVSVVKNRYTGKEESFNMLYMPSTGTYISQKPVLGDLKLSETPEW